MRNFKFALSTEQVNLNDFDTYHDCFVQGFVVISVFCLTAMMWNGNEIWITTQRRKYMYISNRSNQNNTDFRWACRREICFPPIKSGANFLQWLLNAFVHRGDLLVSLNPLWVTKYRSRCGGQLALAVRYYPRQCIDNLSLCSPSERESSGLRGITIVTFAHWCSYSFTMV